MKKIRVHHIAHFIDADGFLFFIHRQVWWPSFWGPMGTLSPLWCVSSLLGAPLWKPLVSLWQMTGANLDDVGALMDDIEWCMSRAESMGIVVQFSRHTRTNETTSTWVIWDLDVSIVVITNLFKQAPHGFADVWTRTQTGRCQLDFFQFACELCELSFFCR